MVSKSSTPFVSVQLLPSNTKNVEPPATVKKPHSMTSLYVDPLTNLNVDPNVVICVKDPVISDVVVNVRTFENLTPDNVVLEKSRSAVTLGHSSSRVGNNHVDVVGVTVSPFEILRFDSVSTQTHHDVAPDVTTSLAQPSHPDETIQETSHKFDNESNPSKSNNKSDGESVNSEKDESV